jgi:hypothetical protein
VLSSLMSTVLNIRAIVCGYNRSIYRMNVYFYNRSTYRMYVYVYNRSIYRMNVYGYNRSISRTHHVAHSSQRLDNQLWNKACNIKTKITLHVLGNWTSSSRWRDPGSFLCERTTKNLSEHNVPVEIRTENLWNISLGCYGRSNHLYLYLILDIYSQKITNFPSYIYIYIHTYIYIYIYIR